MESDRRGGSTARVIIGETLVGKYGGNSSSQAEWLEQHPSPLVPHVHKRAWIDTEQGYIMEKLLEPHYQDWDHERTLLELFNLLEQHVWSQPGRLAFRPLKTLHKVGMVMRKYDVKCADGYALPLGFTTIWAGIKWGSLKTCQTHGDPTFDNIMVRPNIAEELVLVDPIPATPEVPHLRAVDTGKLLQSIIGYEAVKYGPESRWVCRAMPQTLKRLIDDQNEWHATVLWCIIHLLRCIPYIETDKRAALEGLMKDAVDLI